MTPRYFILTADTSADLVARVNRELREIADQPGAKLELIGGPFTLFRRMPISGSYAEYGQAFLYTPSA